MSWGANTAGRRNHIQNPVTFHADWCKHAVCDFSGDSHGVVAVPADRYHGLRLDGIAFERLDNESLGFSWTQAGDFQTTGIGDLYGSILRHDLVRDGRSPRSWTDAIDTGGRE